MTAWTSSPYTSVGVYIGGANRGCSQPNLTKSWVSTVTGQGWRLLPICGGTAGVVHHVGGTTKITADPGQAFAEGAAQGSAAANAAQGLGFGWLAPVYYDMEAYPRGGQCTASVQNFIGGWVQGLNARGYRAGSTAASVPGSSTRRRRPATPASLRSTRSGSSMERHSEHLRIRAPCALSDSLWIDHQPCTSTRVGTTKPTVVSPSTSTRRGRRVHRPVAAGPSARSSLVPSLPCGGEGT